ncbi:MAG: NADH-quinone oxidoreductase subunit J [Planctomycetota bacterium]
MATFAFAIFAGATVLGAILVAFLPRLVHSAFALVLSLIGVAGLFWTLGADFLGATQILLYVGGVTVLILYGVMLTPSAATQWSLRSLLLPGAFAGAASAVLLLLVWRGLNDLGKLSLQAPPSPDPQVGTVAAIGEAFLTRDRYLIPFELASILLLVALVGAVYIARRRQEAA